jgi:phosphomannomutase/phosphoglucomutase
MTMPASIFRAYDIRGIVGETLTESTVHEIGRAFGTVVRERNESTVVVARDGRLSGPTLLKALSDGLRATGCEVINVGCVPTPVLYYASQAFNKCAGIMLTGSHNPGNYNGLKMVLGGVALTEAAIQDLYQRVLKGKFAHGQGGYHTQDITGDYLHDFLKAIKLTRPMKVVLDAGNGVAGEIAPMLFHALGCEVIPLFCEIDGHFPNHHPDPSDPHNLQDLKKAVALHQADVGLAFDGDADRLGVVTSQGEIIAADRLLMVYADALLKVHPKAKIIYDVKCTNHLKPVVEALGGEPIMWKTGHSHIKAKMAAENALLGGEMSGHFFFKDRWNGFDDGLYAGARVLEILATAAHPEAPFANIPNSVNTPEMKIEVDESEKFPLMQRLLDQAVFSEGELITLDGLRVNFADGWGLLRPSNTSPYLIMRFEAQNHAGLSRIQAAFRTWILSVEPALALPF